MKIVFHSVDLDGWSSGAIAYYFLKQRTKEEITLCPMNHGDSYPWTEIQKDEYIYFLDFPPPAPIDNTGFNSGWKSLTEITKNIFWIDHHESSIQKFQGIEIDGIRSNTFPAACELAWKYFNHDSEVPMLIKMISDHDSWKHNIPYSDELCLGLSTLEGIDNPSSDIWGMILKTCIDGNDDIIVEKYVNVGKTIKQYNQQTYAKYVKAFSYEMDWFGYKCVVCNGGMTGSFLFDSVYDESKHDLMLAWIFDGSKYTVSIYTTKTDKVKANDIAKAHGGGGHPGAAGFVCKELPFDLIAKQRYCAECKFLDEEPAQPGDYCPGSYICEMGIKNVYGHNKSCEKFRLKGQET